jgi:cytochrome c2
MKLHYLLLWLLCGLLFVNCSGTSNTTASPEPGTDLSTLSGDALRGEMIFDVGVNDSPPCLACHRVTENGFAFSLGPNLVGIAQRAATRIEGITAQVYLQESILDPDSFVVPGYRDIMYPSFADHFSDQDLADLVAYLMTL